MAKAKKRPSNNKPAEKNQKGLEKIQKAVEQLREEYESKYPFAQDYDAVQTPEGLPTFEELYLARVQVGPIMKRIHYTGIKKPHSSDR